MKTGEVLSASAGPKGEFAFPVSPDSEYRLVGTKDAFLPDEKIISTVGADGPIKTVLELEPQPFELRGIVLNKLTREILPGSDVVLKDVDSGEELTAIADEMGRFTFPIFPDRKYHLIGSLDSYLPDSR